MRLLRVVMVAVTLACVPAARAQDQTQPSQQDQHAHDVAQLQALQQQLLSGTDPCVVLPKLKTVMTRISKESPEAYAAMKPAMDVLNQDTDCPAAPVTPVPPPPPPSGNDSKTPALPAPASQEAAPSK